MLYSIFEVENVCRLVSNTANDLDRRLVLDSDSNLGYLRLMS
jgi:hypothetical protein